MFSKKVQHFYLISLIQDFQFQEPTSFYNAYNRFEIGHAAVHIGYAK